MRAEGLSIALRARTPWEATDLGIALVRNHAGPIWRAWGCLVGPIVLALGLLGHLLGSIWLASALLWWFKPVFDRMLLYVLSRAVFGSVPSLRETLHAQRPKPGEWGPLLAWLTWRRWQPMRALYLPVDFLEQVTGPARLARTSLLARAQGSPGTLLTMLCLAMESMLVGSILLSSLMFVPTEFFSDATRDWLVSVALQPPLWAQWLLYLSYALALSIIEPIYLGAGFGLYLNRRMELEAWDLELAFRQIQTRLSALSRPGDALKIGLCMLLLSLGVPNKQAHAAAAEEAETQNIEQMLELYYVPPDQKFDPALQRALADPALHPQATITQWQLKTSGESPRKKPLRANSWTAVLSGLLGFIVENLLWILLAVAMALALPYLLRLFGTWAARRAAPARDALALTALDIPEPVSAELADAVSALWQQGERRAAIALLYRAAVERLCEKLGEPLPSGATESQCLRLARTLAEQEPYRALFPALVRCWQNIAYAQHEPKWPEVQALLARWQQT